MTMWDGRRCLSRMTCKLKGRNIVNVEGRREKRMKAKMLKRESRRQIKNDKGNIGANYGTRSKGKSFKK